MTADPAPTAAPGGTFGPWVAGLPEGERIARLRALRALAVVFAGGPSSPLAGALLAAERDAGAAARALCLLEGLPALRRRRLLGTYAALSAADARARAGAA